MRLLAPAMALLVLGSCSPAEPENGSAGRGATTPRSVPSSDEAPEAEAGRFRPARIDLQLEPIASGFEAPLIVANAGDGSDRLFVGEQGGGIWILREGERASQAFLDVGSLVTAGGERGLLGLAFHPDFDENGRFFINYTDLNGDTVVAAYESSGDRADPDSARVLMTIDQPYANHNGGALTFGSDGYLYIATGDGGGAGDPEGNGQSLGTLLGKLLRIDIDGRDGESPYAIPPDNPFVDRAGARPEIWAYGLRNPWRFVFDEPTRTIWIADVGQGSWEEINVASADKGGINYGWDVMEGTACFESEDCDRSEKLEPVAQYGHDEGCSVTGGPIYRGRVFPDMRGGYFLGDYCSGTLWALSADDLGAQPLVELAHTERAISSFGIDETGEMYVTDLASGEVLHMVDGS